MALYSKKRGKFISDIGTITIVNQYSEKSLASKKPLFALVFASSGKQFKAFGVIRPQNHKHMKGPTQ